MTMLSKQAAKHMAKKWLRKRKPEDYGKTDYYQLGWWVYVNSEPKIVHMEPVIGTLENGWRE